MYNDPDADPIADPIQDPIEENVVVAKDPQVEEVEKDTTQPDPVSATENEPTPVIPTKKMVESQSTTETAAQNVEVITSSETTAAETEQAVGNVTAIINEVPEGEKVEVIKTVMKNEEVELRTNPLAFANKYLGLNENSQKDQAAVMGFLNSAVPGFLKDSANVTLDSSAWCAAFVHSIITQAGYNPLDTDNEWNRVKAVEYAQIGNEVDGGIKNASPGNVVVIKSKKSGQHHVGFHSGFTNNGIPLMFGGNQSDKVSIKEINLDYYDVIGVRDLGSVANMSEEDLDIINSTEFYSKFRGSTSERTR
tara:strand:- start:273 stop:1193 length:921 start_codon:yes stop_codon:yes gene_type:complete